MELRRRVRAEEAAPQDAAGTAVQDAEEAAPQDAAGTAVQDAAADANSSKGDVSPITRPRAGSNRVAQKGTFRDKAPIQELLESPERKRVIFAFLLHNAHKLEEGFRFHLVLKFWYKAELIEDVFGKEKPEKNDARYGGDASYRIFPYCIFNSIEEVPISWTYTCDANNNVYERCELFCTLSDVTFHRYFPFSLRLVALKIGTDGTAETGLVNLEPEMRINEDGRRVPNIDLGIFQKSTSDFHVKDISEAAIRMVIRDLRVATQGNNVGVYTRVYAAFFFEMAFSENLIKFIVMSIALLHTTVFLPQLTAGEMVGTVVTLVLTEVMFFFVLPETPTLYTTTEIVIMIHALVMLIVLFALGPFHLGENPDAEVLAMQKRKIFAVNCAVTVGTCAFVCWEYSKYRSLVQRIRKAFEPIAMDYVALYEEIDRLI